MQQIPPPQIPSHETDLPAEPTMIPRLPSRLQPGRQAPLPDPVAIRPCAVPATAPPFDDEQATSGNGVAGRTAEDHSAEAGPGLYRGAAPDAVSPQPVLDRDDSDQASQGPPAAWPSQFAQVVAETLAGARPARQLTPWTTEQARKRIRQLGPMLATEQRPQVRRVMTSAPAAGVLEMTAVVGFGARVRVLALRLELEQPRAGRQAAGRWCCTAIESA